MDIYEVGWGGLDRIDLAQDKGEIAVSCECMNEPSGSIKCREFLENLRTF